MRVFSYHRQLSKAEVSATVVCFEAGAFSENVTRVIVRYFGVTLSFVSSLYSGTYAEPLQRWLARLRYAQNTFVFQKGKVATIC